MINMKQIPNRMTYTSNDRALRFLLGGIATGNISIDAKGELCDFEIFNKPSKGTKLPYSFFALRYESSSKCEALVLESRYDGICDEPMGISPSRVSGLPRFDSSEFTSAYPFAQVDFYKKDFPLSVSLQAFNPFIPLDDKNSGIPVACLTYRVTNHSSEKATVSIAGSLPNACGLESVTADGVNKMYLYGHPTNKVIKNNSYAGIAYSTSCPNDMLTYGTMALLTDETVDFSAKSCWLDEGWWDGAEEFWKDFTDDGVLQEAIATNKERSRINGVMEEKAIGSIAVQKTIEAGESADFVFYITWHFPNRYGWWPDGYDARDRADSFCKDIFQTYYSTIWKNALDVADYVIENRKFLEETSELFAVSLYNSTLDPVVIDAAAANITVFRSPVCFRIADGKFYGWEGNFAQAGSCPGTCTHVWNYAQTLANLFPELEKNFRETEFLEETDDEGMMSFRAKRHLEGTPWDMYPAVDGQLGCILRVYREWKMTGDDDFLKRVWTKVLKVLDYAEKVWDLDGDYVLDSQQHNTYDIEFYGIQSLGNAIYFAALRAVAKMAEYLGENDLSMRYLNMAEAGAKKMDQMIYNGEFYSQKIEEGVDQYKYQYGEGCISDQLLGQELAHLYGLGYVLPEEHVRSAIYSVYKYNYRPEMGDHYSLQRGYAYQDEPGLLLCSWPNGGRPIQPFVYSDEVWTGIEYQVATHMIYEGYIDEAMEIVRAVRSRYEGKRRNPFNEVECGNHYARSMASWGLINALSGIQVDLPHGSVTIDPKVNKEDFACFYSTGKEWGVCTQKKTADGGFTQVFEKRYEIE